MTIAILRAAMAIQASQPKKKWFKCTNTFIIQKKWGVLQYIGTEYDILMQVHNPIAHEHPETQCTGLQFLLLLNAAVTRLNRMEELRDSFTLLYKLL